MKWVNLLICKSSLVLILIAGGFFSLLAQSVKVGSIDYVSPPAGVIMEFNASNQAVLFPRVSNPSSSIGSDARAGMAVYNTSNNQLEYYNGSNWVSLRSSTVVENISSNFLGVVFIGPQTSTNAALNITLPSPVVSGASPYASMSPGNSTINAGSGNYVPPAPRNRLSIYTEQSIMANGEIIASSDKRIKKDIQQSNAIKDLEILNKIKISNYKYIDTIEKGNEIQKKVIAQELNEVYPLAVHKTPDFIPNVYSMADTIKVISNNDQGITYRVELSKIHDFKNGDLIKIYYFSKDNLIEREDNQVINIVNNNTFDVLRKKEKANAIGVFVYGKRVDNFLSVDYDALSMLNISATQELHRKLKAESKKIKNLEKKIDELQKLIQQKL